MKYFLGSLWLAVTIQFAIYLFWPISIVHWEWWVTTLPLSMVIKMSIEELLKV